MVIKVKTEGELIEKDVKKRQALLDPILEDFIADVSDIWNDIAQTTVLNGSLKGFGVKTGETKRRGFSFYHHKSRKKKTFNFAGFWAPIANLFENFKNRPKVLIFKAMSKNFEKDARTETALRKAVERLAK